jgi:hypothetical protein
MNLTRISSLTLCTVLGVFLSVAAVANQAPTPPQPPPSTADFLASLATPPQTPAGLGQVSTPTPRLAAACTTSQCPNPHEDASCDNECACIPTFSCNVSTCTTHCGCRVIPNC